MDAVTEERKQDWTWKTGSPEKQERLERFIEWCLMPRSQRQPASKAQLAEELGVTTQTLRNYQRDPEFQKEVGRRARALARVDRLPAVLDALYEQAIDIDNPRSVTAAKTLLDFAEKATDSEAKGVDPKDMSSEDLVKVALELLHKANGEPAPE